MWSEFTVRIDINTSIEKLYEAWTTQAGMEYWFLRESSFFDKDGRQRDARESVQPGDSYLWRWHGYPDETFEKDTVLDCNGLDLLQFRFGKAGRCTVRIYKEQETTIVELTQDQIPDEDDKSRMNCHVGCRTGWIFHLANMKSIFEGGVDLRNRNEALKNMINA